MNLKYPNNKQNTFESLSILGFEPYFNNFVTVGYINHINKIIRPAFGYFYPHKYGRRLKAKAKKIGYNFTN